MQANLKGEAEVEGVVVALKVAEVEGDPSTKNWWSAINVIN